MWALNHGWGGTHTLLEERGLEFRAASRAIDRDRRRHRDGGVVALVQVERVALGLEERAILKAACRCEKLWVERQLAASDAGEEQQQRQEHREDRMWMTGRDHPARATLSAPKQRWNGAPRLSENSIQVD